MSNSDQVLIVGTVDCNNQVNISLVSFSLGKPSRSAAEYGGPTVDVARVGPVDTSPLVDSRFLIQVKTSSVDATMAIVAAITEQIGQLAAITVGLKNSECVGTMLPRIAECIEIPQESPWDSRLVNQNATQVEIAVRRDPYIYAATETLHNAASFTLPGVVSLAAQTGQCAAPYALLFDFAALECNALFCGRYPDESAQIADFCFGAVDIAWSGGSAAADAAGYPDGVGDNLWRNQSATEVHADIDVTAFEPGEYLLVAKCKATTAGHGTIRHAYRTAVEIPTTSLGLLPLGIVSLPTTAVRGTSSSNLRVYLAGDGTDYGYANVFFLIPASFGGLIGWRRASGHAHEVRFEDEMVYADDVGALGEAFAGRRVLGVGGLLVAVAEQATPDHETVAAITVTEDPRWEQLPVPPDTDPLGDWFNGGISGKTIVFWGDSTTSNAVYMFSGTPRALAWQQNVGEQLEGTTILNYGNNGATLRAALDGSVTYDLDAVIAADPELVVMSWLINDVRLGACSLTTAKGRLEEAISAIQAALPDCDILMMTPLAFLTDDPGSTGWVNPLASAQAYTDLLWQAYHDVSLAHPEVYLLDAMTLIGGRTCVPYASNPYMTDIMHPNQTGQEAKVAELLPVIGYRAAFSPASALAARASNYAADYSVYYRAVEDDDYYWPIATGVWADQGSGYITFGWPYARKDEIRASDILCVGTTAPWILPIGVNPAQSGANTRLLSLGAGNPPGVITGGTVSVYRHKYRHDRNVELYWHQDVLYPYRWQGIIIAAGSGYIDVGCLASEKLAKDRSSVVATDVLVAKGIAPLTLTGFTFAASGNNLRLLHSGDWSAYAGMPCAIFGNHLYEDGSSARQVDGTLPWLQVN